MENVFTEAEFPSAPGQATVSPWTGRTTGAFCSHSKHSYISLHPACLLLLPLRILCSTPFAVATYFLIWFVPPIEQVKVVWYLVFYCLFQSMQTVSTTHREHPAALLISVCVALTEFCLMDFAVLPRAVFSSHHVHQHRSDRAGLRHCLSYVSAPAPLDRFMWFPSLILHPCPTQA